MKKIISLFMSVVLLFSLSACGSDSRDQPPEDKDTENAITESQDTSVQTTQSKDRNAAAYEIDEKDIAVMGFSAGGILAGEMLLNFAGNENGTALDASYIPDELDKVSADAGADGMIYSFYGRLSVASTDVEKFAASDLPPTYFCYGTRDPFVGEFE